MVPLNWLARRHPPSKNSPRILGDIEKGDVGEADDSKDPPRSTSTNEHLLNRHDFPSSGPHEVDLV